MNELMLSGLKPFGLNVGDEAIASTRPVSRSSTTAAPGSPLRAFCTAI
ncbi:MAG TPA: hypothetical protein VLD65_07215 [Anaerolineales bacterium]|nr:hypothetical protein [Anaerolineales bacterium]